MNLRDLRYFVALADTKHFGKAAERSFVSQPTLSAQLKKLENYLGVQLIERQQIALFTLSARIADHPRRAPHERNRPMSRLLKPPQHYRGEQRAHVQAVARRIKTGVQRPRARREPAAELLRLGRLVN